MTCRMRLGSGIAERKSLVREEKREHVGISGRKDGKKHVGQLAW